MSKKESMATFTGERRLLTLTTPFGEDALLLTSFNGTEEISRLFNYQLEMLSEKDSIDAADIVGKDVTWSIQHLDSDPRIFNGVVSRFAASGRLIRGLRAYRAVVVPWLWFLTRSANCRIFQKKSVPDIIQAVFDDLGFSDYEIALKGSYAPWEYCVQYRETAFNFVSRLMEQEGIFYFFRHEDGKHTLVLADRKTAYQECPDSQVKYSEGSLSANHITSWEHAYEFRPGKWAQTDYNFETPSTNLLASTNTLIELPNIGNFEIFDYPGEYEVKGDGDALAKVRMQEEEVPYNVVRGSSQCATFTPGSKFTLETGDVEAESGKSYVITAIQHSATDTSFGPSTAPSSYRNQFTCIPDSVPFRPARTTPKPTTAGVQTAVVVGPAGEEIYTDKYSRVKVQFFWDREGKRDENSSCWIRVATAWAGKGWGQLNIPRIGHEVVVQFLEGDPDRPLIIGGVYNAENMPAGTLPTDRATSGMKSATYPGSKGYNQVFITDTKNKEMITIHGQKDMTTTIEHDETLHVKNDRSITVDGKHTETITKDTKIKIVSGPYDHDVAGNTAHYHVQGALTEDYDTTQTTTVANDIVITSKSTCVHIKAATEIQLLVGASKLLMKNDGSIELSGNNIAIKGAVTVQVKGGSITEEADTDFNMKGAILVTEGAASNTVKGGMVMLNP
jgi:type VI secretion system secreted protein VgrG